MPKDSNNYIEAIGRRKTSTARVRLTPSSKNSFVINDKSLSDYFKVKEYQDKATAALTNIDGKFTVTVMTKGGGVSSQAEAVRLGVSRALIVWNSELRRELKKEGYLKRDPRSKERRKFGLKKARKAPQWSKR